LEPGAERILGYREDEAIGRAGAFIFTPEDIANGAPEQELSQATREGRVVSCCSQFTALGT